MGCCRVARKNDPPAPSRYSEWAVVHETPARYLFQMPFGKEAVSGGELFLIIINHQPRLIITHNISTPQQSVYSRAPIGLSLKKSISQ